MEKFQSKRGPSAYIPITIGFVILLAPLVAIYFDPPDDFSIRLRWSSLLALIPISIFGFFTYVLIASSFKLFITYTITSKGIKIYKPPFHLRVFSFNEIDELRFMSEEETKKIIEDSIMEQNSYGESADIIGYFSMIKKKSPHYRYFTISPQAKVSTVGPKETITSLDVKSTGGAVLLTLKNGEKFYLTPDDPQRFSDVYLRIRSN